MGGGLRYGDVGEMPPGMRERLVAQVLEKVSGHPAPVAEEKEDPCLECLRWGECNGVDDGCPFR